MSNVSTEPGQTQGSRRLNLREIKEAPAATDESVGMELRAMRLQRGETIPQVSQVLRIRKDMVEAIEHGRHDLLPGHAYEIGFVRAYADYLRLDTADVVRRYKAELAALDESKHFTIQVPEEEQRFSFVSIGIIVLCLAAAGGGAWYLAKQAGWLDGNRPLGPGAPAVENDTGTTPAPDGMEPSAGGAPTVATPAVTQPAVAPPPVATPPAPPPPPPAPPPRPGGIVAPGPGETAQPITGREMGKSNSTSRITYIARREAMLTVTGPRSRQPYINRTLTAGDAYRLPNLPDLKVDISDAGAMDVVLDGAYIGRAGADGTVVTDFAVSPEAYGAPAERPTPAATPEAVPPAATPAAGPGPDGTLPPLPEDPVPVPPSSDAAPIPPPAATPVVPPATEPAAPPPALPPGTVME